MPQLFESARSVQLRYGIAEGAVAEFSEVGSVQFGRAEWMRGVLHDRFV